MGVFWRAFLGAAAGRIAITTILAVLTVLGFGVSYWVPTVMNWWGAHPADATVELLRVVGAVVGVVCICLIVWPYIWAAIRPRKFSVSFETVRDVHVAVPLFDQTGQLPHRATIAHVHVEAVHGYVTPCTGAITALERLDDENNVIGRIDGTRQLLWAPRERGQFQQIIAPHVPQDLDLFCTLEATNRLDVLSVGHPPLWTNFFASPGRYRITVAVHGDNRTETIRVIVNWRGRWDDFDAA
jgi:hypothetical protein